VFEPGDRVGSRRDPPLVDVGYIQLSASRSFVQKFFHELTSACDLDFRCEKSWIGRQSSATRSRGLV
jgi:hypothetical protein